MKIIFIFSFLTVTFVYAVGEMGLWDEFKQKAEVVHQYEYKALELSRQLRLMKRENESLRGKLARVRSEKEHLELSFNAKAKRRSIASVQARNVNDLVNFKLYKWSPEKLLGVGERALHFKKFEKSSQFYNTLLNEYPHHKSITDKVLFEAGISAYESKKHYDWANKHLNTLVKRYPKSKFYRGAKLWLALSHFYQGDKKSFIATVDEFRRKYRNTAEWKVLSKYYEDLNYKYKR